MIQPDSPRVTIWRMRFTWWIREVINTHSDYVILIAFPQEQWLGERALNITFISILSVFLACGFVRLW
jgi:hypothetical protein